MTTRSVAAALGASPSSVNRTELGQRTPSREEVGALCALYGVTGEQKHLLVDRAGKSSANSAWLGMSSRPEKHDQLATMLALESEAAAIVNVQLALVPGLAQIADHVREMLSTTQDGPDLESNVATRLGR